MTFRDRIMSRTAEDRSEQRAFYGATLRLAFPVMLQSLLSGSFAMIDTLMVGSLGDTALSAIAMASQWTEIHAALIGGITATLGIFAAQRFGIGDRRGIRTCGGIALLLLSVCVLAMLLPAQLCPGLILGFYTASPQIAALGIRYLRIAAFAYPLTALEACLCAMLRGTGQVRLPLTAALASMCLNVCGNFVLIYGKLGLPAMGVEGAALATVLSAAASPLILLIYAGRRPTILSAPIAEYLGFRLRDIAEFLRRCLPLIANLFLYTLGQTVVTATFMRSGDYHAAALSILGSVNGLVNAFYSGLSASTHILVGQQIGAGEIRKARRSSVRYIVIVSALSAVLCALMLLLRVPTIRLFNLRNTLSPDTVSAVSVLLVFLAWDRFPAYFHGEIMDGIFRAGGDTPASAVIDIVSVWCVAVPAALLCVRLWQLPFLTAYIAVRLTEHLPKCVVTLLYFRSDRWMKPVTEVGKAAVAAYRKAKRSASLV